MMRLEKRKQREKREQNVAFFVVAKQIEGKKQHSNDVAKKANKQLHDKTFVFFALCRFLGNSFFYACYDCISYAVTRRLLTDILALVVLYHLGQFQIAGNYGDLYPREERQKKKKAKTRSISIVILYFPVCRGMGICIMMKLLCERKTNGCRGKLHVGSVEEDELS